MVTKLAYTVNEKHTRRDHGVDLTNFTTSARAAFCASNTTTGCNGPTTKTTTVYGGDRK